MLLSAGLVLIAGSVVTLLLESHPTGSTPPITAAPAHTEADPVALRARRGPDAGARAARAVPSPRRTVWTPPSRSLEPVTAVAREGRTVQLHGRITIDGQPTPARLEMLAGLDAGVTWATAADGTFVQALYPGFTLVTVHAAGATCTREVRLRHRRRQELTFDFGHHGWVHGRVRDEQGRPVEGAQVSLDGEVVTTNAAGHFAALQGASGAPLLIVQRSGFAAYREQLPASGATPRDVHEITLRPGCRLSVAARGAGGTSHVYLLPHAGGARTAGGSQPAYPGHLSAPLVLAAGEARVIDDLPRGRYTVWAISERAQGQAEVSWLTPERSGRVEVPMRPLRTRTGRVLRHGEAVVGAQVELEVGNHARAAAAALSTSLLKSLPVLSLPSARQRVAVGGDGGFAVACPDGVGASYLTVTAPGEPARIFALPERYRGSLVIELGEQAAAARRP